MHQQALRSVTCLPQAINYILKQRGERPIDINTLMQTLNFVVPTILESYFPTLQSSDQPHLAGSYPKYQEDGNFGLKRTEHFPLYSSFHPAAEVPARAVSDLLQERLDDQCDVILLHAFSSPNEKRLFGHAAVIHSYNKITETLEYIDFPDEDLKSSALREKVQGALMIKDGGYWTISPKPIVSFETAL